MSICECGQVSVPLGKVSVLVFGTIHGVTACGPSDRHWKDRAEKAEATIQRVREVCRNPSSRMLATSHMNVEWVDLNAVLNALEGDNDE